MFGSDVNPEAGTVLAELDTVLQRLNTLVLDSHSDSEVLALWRELEHRRRTLAPIDHALIAQLQTRNVPHTLGERSMTTLARSVLRVGIGEAKARVVAAEALGPRRTLLGEPLEPLYPVLAAAQAAGQVSEPAAKLIVHTIEQLPDAVRAEVDRDLEHTLTKQAGELDLDQLRTLTRHVSALLDPDGLLTQEAQRQRQREVNLAIRPDGSGRLSGNCTVELTEWIRTIFDTLAKPKPATTGATTGGATTDSTAGGATDAAAKDPRTAPQRRHDALLEALKLTARAELLPDCGGISSTLLLSMTREAFLTGTGTATTGHGTIVHAKTAREWAGGGDTLVQPVWINQHRRIEALGTPCRIFTRQQRHALIIRDKGCSFPGCDAPPQHCQVHHIVPWADGGPTHIDNGCLLCTYHHRTFERLGWVCTMLKGVPHWVPPAWTGNQTPIRNTAHDPRPSFPLKT
ncbi:HNH endonuclease [Jatrophihabitans cynanchi]|uniref:HNH endonuclease n=1 Tax=Jatrophihabitans cynanchi TaxID=2944128 RepID=A0ABY7JZ51_9ACTN|nr:HNH endonuclease signature motif containing protein [Jatrophihabitans sp. SB3-54]WAX56429.1 HNH endonuclease [Jatrophihabitans sp. SB3-54]